MIKSFRRLFVIYRDYRGRLILSQLLVLISAAATIGVATLTQRVINDGLLKTGSGVVIETGIWMIVLGLVAAAALAGAAVFAVFFSEGTADVIRSEPTSSGSRSRTSTGSGPGTSSFAWVQTSIRSRMPARSLITALSSN